MILSIVPKRMMLAKEIKMKMKKANWFSLLFTAVTAVCCLPTPANAQDDARELYRKMYEGGLITRAEYENTTGESAPAIRSSVSSDNLATEETAGNTESVKSDSAPKNRHRSLNVEGIPATVEQF